MGKVFVYNNQTSTVISRQAPIAGIHGNMLIVDKGFNQNDIIAHAGGLHHRYMRHATCCMISLMENNMREPTILFSEETTLKQGFAHDEARVGHENEFGMRPVVHDGLR